MRFGKVNWIRMSFDDIRDERGEAFDFASQTLNPIKESIRHAINKQKQIQDYFEKLSQEKVSLRDEEYDCLLYTSPSPRDRTRSRMPSSA